MSQLNQMDLQNLRHLIGASEVMGKQLGLYAQQCQDQQLRGFLENEARAAAQGSRNLLGFLQT